MMIKVFKVRNSAKIPERAHSSDAGLDVFYSPDKEHSFDYNRYGVKGTCHVNLGDIHIQPKQNAIVPTGIKIAIDHGYMLQVCNRSSMGAIKNLIAGAHIIDSGYSGEIYIDLHNIGEIEQIVEPYDKIAQLVMIPVVHVIPIIVEDELNLYGPEQITISDRKEGALGSSDKKNNNANIADANMLMSYWCWK